MEEGREDDLECLRVRWEAGKTIRDNPLLENCLLTERGNFATQKVRRNGAQWSRTAIFNIRLGVVWTYRRGDKAAG